MLETKGQICTEDPQQVTFKNGVNKWVLGEISYQEMMDKYPTYLLKPHEQFLRLIADGAMAFYRKSIGTDQH